MPKIHILDPLTVSKIAAGEVIERPASVVKELIENSIDAGATQITIETEEGGRKLIRVTDNGCGMMREDAVLAVQKHATSKLETIEDLETLSTLGFRGEALASICAAANITITTKLNEPSVHVGTQIRMENGVVVDVNDIGAPSGTTIEVKDLFSAIPARLKYLKPIRTELAHITETVTRFAFGHPDIRFRLSHDRTEIINTAPARNLKDLVAILFGPETVQALVPVKYEDARIKLRGFVAKPHCTRSTADAQFIYVNNRFVKSQLVTIALKEAYGTLLPKSRHPIAILYLTVPTNEIDVNIHPTKLQIKFNKEREVYDKVVKTVHTALHGGAQPPTPTLQRILPGVSPTPEIGPPAPKRELPRPHPPAVVGVEKRLKPTRLEGPMATEQRRSIYEINATLHSERSKECEKRNNLPEMKVLGQLKNSYILAETEHGLVVLDQHAVHERILMERVAADYNAKKMGSQQLLTPLNIELSPKERVELEEHIAMIREIGFELKEFGKNTYCFTAVPSVLPERDAKSVVLDIIHGLSTSGRLPENELRNEIIYMIACKNAIKAGDRCTHEQMQRLIEQLYYAENPYSCPHGRPTIVNITIEQLEREFKRR